MMKIALDAGHGIHTAGKRTPDGEREWSFNDKVLRACIAKLNTYQDVEIKRLDDPTGQSDVPLAIRTNTANLWKADALVSIHHNANAGIWGSHGGVETYVQEKTASKASKDLAAAIQPRIVQAMGLRDRGVRTSNLHMTRESRMPAILTEGGFMDSTTDIDSLRNDAKLKAQGEAIADGLANYFSLKLKAGTPSKGETIVANTDQEKNAKPSPALASEFAKAKEVGITDGTYPNRVATRAEVAVMNYRVYESILKQLNK